MSVSLALTALALAGCNSSSVVGAPVATETPVPTATPANPQAPVAIIDNNSPIYDTLDTAEFDGWLSYDPDGYIVTYDWNVTAKPAGSTATMLPDTFGGQTSQLYIDMPGDYTISLKVTDDSGLTDTKSVSFSATISAFHVQLTWVDDYGNADIDLHLINRTAMTPAPDLWNSQYDCDYHNCKPSQGQDLDWGTPGYVFDDPRLDVDNIDTNVPENMNIEYPKDGTYRIEVHWFGGSGGSDVVVHPTVNIFFGGALFFTTSGTLSQVNDVWTVADVAWLNSAGTINYIGTHSTTTQQ